MSGRDIGKLACVAAVAVFALWFRLHFIHTVLWDRPVRADAGQYYSIAWNLVHHGVFSMAHPGDAIPAPDSYRGPGYPLLVALSLRLGGDAHWVGILLFTQAMLGTLSTVLTIMIAKRWLPFAYAVAAGLLVAIWPHAVTLSGLVLTETFYGFSILLGVYLLGRASESRRAYHYVLAGLVFGYAALINLAVLLFPIIVAAVHFFTQRRNALLFLLCTLLLPGAWAIRGAMLEQDRTASSRLMENVFAGMEPEWSYDLTPAATAAASRVQQGVQLYKRDPASALKLALDRLSDNPSFYAEWYLLRKPLRLWQWSMLGYGDIYVYTVVKSPFISDPFYRGVTSLCYGLNPWLFIAALCFLLVLIAGSLRPGHEKRNVFLVYVTMVFVYTTLLHSLLTPDPRYATPFRPFEILLALSLLAQAQQYWGKRRQLTASQMPSPPETTRSSARPTSAP